EDHRERQQERGDEDRAPETSRPAQYRSEGVRHVLVLMRCGGGDRCGQAEGHGGHGHDDRVGGAPVPGPRLGLREERQAPGAARRHGRLPVAHVRRRHSPDFRRSRRRAPGAGWGETTGMAASSPARPTWWRYARPALFVLVTGISLYL